MFEDIAIEEIVGIGILWVIICYVMYKWWQSTKIEDRGSE